MTVVWTIFGIAEALHRLLASKGIRRLIGGWLRDYALAACWPLVPDGWQPLSASLARPAAFLAARRGSNPRAPPA
ncbi:MAG: hypothetical protein A2087_02140 [Spirochaetes bacterium GWD1_61_31]|nr:MAG: hypothetical protein A2Y37_11875 [Spirochaetes bacterium GWB1_60_80]OHD35688.1 MAG: hypothetical protein A2004_02990 [Spirochaetes bacterium GWC1_61_12]OHD43822.1 MAG: hypothetical protein A2087_02140 [Spirochaetes bacterium GWD1_61_31]OHD46065.1 MAG: hypothetical protein A2Y35_13700 [Spirochaetes bacterium GWE1_60_18]OHD60637.1 MAG: hypothetical protein A2Y32_08190 [Spirochaetes bacterium GWF1_60_12]HAP44254.1 hypothetical protein [Spirochaetaceae bacterium]